MNLTTADPMRPGTWIQRPGERLLMVTACTGTGPFTLAVRPVSRWDRWLVRIKKWLGAPKRWWLDTRCLPGDGWCWRKATADSLCDRHWLRAIEDGGEYL